MVDLFRYRKWDLVSKRGLYYVISGLMILAGMISWAMYGLHQGIDFKGGGLVTYRVAGTLPEADHPQIIGEIRDALEKAGIENEVQISAGSHEFGLGHDTSDVILVRTLRGNNATTNEDEDNLLTTQTVTITKTVSDVLTAHHITEAPKLEGTELVSGIVSSELIHRGIFAVILGCILILCWIWLRYNIGGFGWKYAVAGILALAHDLLTLVGMTALLRAYVQVNSPFIAALLTVLGYSIHDTIVIFDRIRENMRLRKGRTFAEVVNTALLETMARSVNTILTVLFSLLALFFFGGPTLRDFTVAMLIGVTVGGYSSIFIASQLLVSWAKPSEKVMLPLDAPVAGAPAATLLEASVVAAPVLATPSGGPVAKASSDAVERAKAAGRAAAGGKTARRKR